MPNGNTHIRAGAVLGALGSIVLQAKAGNGEQTDFGHVLLSTGAATLVSRLPDVLEPATSPNHRDFFHSVFFGGIVGIACRETWNELKCEINARRSTGQSRPNNKEVGLGLLLIVESAILLHLVMDSSTKRSLPLI